MTVPVIQPSFAAGELSPQLYSRVDLAKFHIAAALLRNFFVDYRGGASNRPGTKFVARGRDSAHTIRLIPFQYNVLQAYVLEFGNFYMRVHMNGAPVLEPPKNIATITNANPGQVTLNAHGFLNGDTLFLSGISGMTQLNGQTVLAAGVTANTFTMTDLDGNPIDTTAYGLFTGAGTVGRVFTMATPYAASDLALLKFVQSADTMTLTHVNYKGQVLTRTQHYAWTMVPLVFGAKVNAPTGQAVVPGSAGTTGYRYVVTALSPDQTQESAPSQVAQTLVGATMSTTPGAFNTVSWNAVSGAGGYNVYRQLEIPGGVASTGSLYGFVGTTLTASFVDHNIAPDFSLTPPQVADPFNKGSIVSVPVTAGGAGYLAVPDTEIVITDVTGTGGQVSPVIAAGVITGVIISNPGQLYTAPTFLARTRVGSGAYGTFQVVGGNVTNIVVTSGGNNYASNITWAFGTASGSWNINANGTILSANITVPASGLPNGLYSWNSALGDVIQTQAGAGATFGAAVLTSTNNNPGCVTYFQSRQMFGGSNAAPSTIWMSVSGDYFNMNFSNPSKSDDAMTIALVSREVNAIKWLVAMNSLIALTSRGAWRIDGGSQSDAITPTAINAVPQAYNGAADVPPIIVNNDILYVQAKGSIIRDLTYNFYVNIYTGQDVTVLASHLFAGHQILEWAWAEEPYKIVWAVREDGTLLSLTYVKDQDVYGWARHDTLGAFKSICTITEGNEDAVYMVVSRLINGVYLQFVERFATRQFQDDITQAWFVDCGLSYPLTFLNATATPSAQDPNTLQVTLSIDHALFNAGQIGNQVKINGGVGRIVTFIDNQHVVVQMTHPLNNIFPALPNTWSCTAPVASVSGLFHLKGQTVTGIVDGSVMSPRVVDNTGTIALDQPGVPSVIGLAYQGQVQTMYLPDMAGAPTIQGRRKTIPAVTLRLHNTRGLKAGPNFSALTEMKERSDLPVMLPAPIGQVDQTITAFTPSAGDPIFLTTGDEREAIDLDYTVPGQVCIQQDYPLPATITAVIPEVDVGDTPTPD